MKIKIEFTQEEKDTIMNSVSMASEDAEIEDHPYHIKGKFGFFKYDAKKNNIEFDLCSDFIKAYLDLGLQFVGLFKSVFKLCNNFVEYWFLDTVEVNEELDKIKKDIERFVDLEFSDRSEEEDLEYVSLNDTISEYFKSVSEGDQLELLDYKHKLEELKTSN